jgi:hypothetical protein
MIDGEKPSAILEINSYPNTGLERDRCFNEIFNEYNRIVEASKSEINVFPLGPIPALVYLGFLLQNNSSNIVIHQYSKSLNGWVSNEQIEQHLVRENFVVNDCRVLAIAVSISSVVLSEDIQQSLNLKHDLYSISIENPGLDEIRYKSDIKNIKSIIHKRLNGIYSKYDKIHLYLAAPEALCVEIGRIIRKNMFPNTFTYQYSRTSTPKYKRIANLIKKS